MLKANVGLRQKARQAGVHLWEIAEKLNVSEPAMTRKLRRELSENEKRKIIEIIHSIELQKQNSQEQ